jgi:membrane-associated protease RseP (regulator of RpoE activity)
MLYKKTFIYPSDGFFHDTSSVFSQRKQSPKIHILLFILTLLTTTAVGAIMASDGQKSLMSINVLLKGLPFSITILSVLGIHEFAHYFTARSWGINVTLPYFIPAPILPIGTFGAVIKMKSAIPNRRALVDVGASGPIAGFFVSVVACLIGLHMSSIVPKTTASSFILGDSILFSTLTNLVVGSLPDNSVLLLHPIAFAGWIGLFVTALNLLPIGQLDGGHILFALSPRIHELIREIRIPVLLLLGLIFWNGWYV